MPPFLAEVLGTMLLIILGDGVVANVVLNKTKGQNSGWIVITAGWAFGVAVPGGGLGAVNRAPFKPPPSHRPPPPRQIARAPGPRPLPAPEVSAVLPAPHALL